MKRTSIGYLLNEDPKKTKENTIDLPRGEAKISTPTPSQLQPNYINLSKPIAKKNSTPSSQLLPNYVNLTTQAAKNNSNLPTQVVENIINPPKQQLTKNNSNPPSQVAKNNTSKSPSPVVEDTSNPTKQETQNNINSPKQTPPNNSNSSIQGTQSNTHNSQLVKRIDDTQKKAKNENVLHVRIKLAFISPSAESFSGLLDELTKNDLTFYAWILLLRKLNIYQMNNQKAKTFQTVKIDFCKLVTFAFTHGNSLQYDFSSVGDKLKISSYIIYNLGKLSSYSYSPFSAASLDRLLQLINEFTSEITPDKHIALHRTITGTSALRKKGLEGKLDNQNIEKLIKKLNWKTVDSEKEKSNHTNLSVKNDNFQFMHTKGIFGSGNRKQVTNSSSLAPSPSANAQPLSADFKNPYTFKDIKEILLARVQYGYAKMKIKETIHVLKVIQGSAALDNIAPQVKAFIGQQKDDAKGPLQLLIPIFVAKQWVGLKIKLNENKLTEIKYYNSKSDDDDFTRINCIKKSFVQQDLITADRLILVDQKGLQQSKDDCTNSGPLMIENFYCDLTKTLWQQVEERIASPHTLKEIRENHLFVSKPKASTIQFFTPPSKTTTNESSDLSTSLEFY